MGIRTSCALLSGARWRLPRRRTDPHPAIALILCESDHGTGGCSLTTGRCYIANYVLDDAPKGQIRGYRAEGLCFPNSPELAEIKPRSRRHKTCCQGGLSRSRVQEEELLSMPRRVHFLGLSRPRTVLPGLVVATLAVCPPSCLTGCRRLGAVVHYRGRDWFAPSTLPVRDCSPIRQSLPLLGHCTRTILFPRGQSSGGPIVRGLVQTVAKAAGTADGRLEDGVGVLNFRHLMADAMA